MAQQISLVVARRFLAIRHLLAPPRALPATPESVMAVVDRFPRLKFMATHFGGLILKLLRALTQRLFFFQELLTFRGALRLPLSL